MLACLGVAGCAPAPFVRVDGVRLDRLPSIRVGVVTDADLVQATGTGRFALEDVARGERVGESGRGLVWKLKPAGARVNVTDPDGRTVGLFVGPIRFVPLQGGGRIWVAGVEYRGRIEVAADKKDRLTVVNDLDLESYLRGVVPAEIGRLIGSQAEAAKAQAIAARTYALSNRGRHAADGFDLLATVDDQVYRGYTSETRLTDDAIAKTRGVIAVYKGRLIEPYYSSTCGGRTESIQEGWKRPPVPYLKSVSDRGSAGAFCQLSPQFRWTERWDREGLERILALTLATGLNRKDGGDGLRLLDLRIRKRSRSGRVYLLEIKTNRGVMRVEGDQVRRVLRRPVEGFPPLRSTLFTLQVARDRAGRPSWITADGGGYGHGIGLCQTGAIGMANRGYRFDQILRHYYPGIRLSVVY